jgi:hypothetical protein
VRGRLPPRGFSPRVACQLARLLAGESERKVARLPQRQQAIGIMRPGAVAPQLPLGSLGLIEPLQLAGDLGGGEAAPLAGSACLGDAEALRDPLVKRRQVRRSGMVVTMFLHPAALPRLFCLRSIFEKVPPGCQYRIAGALRG